MFGCVRAGRTRSLHVGISLGVYAPCFLPHRAHFFLPLSPASKGRETPSAPSIVSSNHSSHEIRRDYLSTCRECFHPLVLKGFLVTYVTAKLSLINGRTRSYSVALKRRRHLPYLRLFLASKMNEKEKERLRCTVNIKYGIRHDQTINTFWRRQPPFSS